MLFSVRDFGKSTVAPKFSEIIVSRVCNYTAKYLFFIFTVHRLQEGVLEARKFKDPSKISHRREAYTLVSTAVAPKRSATAAIARNTKELTTTRYVSAFFSHAHVILQDCLLGIKYMAFKRLTLPVLIPHSIHKH